MATEDRISDMIVTSLKYDGSRGRLTDDFPLIDSHMIDSLDKCPSSYPVSRRNSVA
jgi:hypothetical protein